MSRHRLRARPEARAHHYPTVPACLPTHRLQSVHFQSGGELSQRPASCASGGSPRGPSAAPRGCASRRRRAQKGPPRCRWSCRWTGRHRNLAVPGPRPCKRPPAALACQGDSSGRGSKCEVRHHRGPGITHADLGPQPWGSQPGPNPGPARIQGLDAGGGACGARPPNRRTLSRTTRDGSTGHSHMPPPS